MSAHLKRFLPTVFLLSFSFTQAFASHLVGDEFTYKLMDSVGGLYHYQVTLTLYADCLAGEPEAIAQDDPAYFAVYKGTGELVETDSAHHSSSATVPVSSSSSCGSGSTTLCVLKRTFVIDIHLHPCASGYIIAYQRCCRNGAITNIVDPRDHGVTYSCSIPSSAVAASNNGAVFVNYPPLVLALDEPFSFDDYATDADGDSLSYELCEARLGGSDAVIKPYPPAPPPYDNETYAGGLSYSNPMSCSVPLTIDPVTGVLSGTPDVLGRYLISVCCNEWRGGVLISTVRREFEFAVVAGFTLTYQPSAGADTSIYVGDSVQFHASGAVSYHWTPGSYLTDATISNPVGHFTDPGIFTYVLHGISDSGCTGYDTLIVNVLERSEMMLPNAFTPNGDGINDMLVPLPVKNSTLQAFKVYDRKFQLIYSGTRANCAWDGKHNGVKLDMGSYFWEVVYTDNSGKTRNSKGTVTLIR